MGSYYNRKLLLLNQDVPFSASIPPDTQPATTTINNNNNNNSSSSSSSSTTTSTKFERPLQLTPRPIFSSNVAYAFIIIFTALSFLAFIYLYIRQISGRSPAQDSSRRRHPHASSEGVDPVATAESLPAFSYGGDEKQQVDCVICLEEFMEGEKVKMMACCKHVFHQECIDKWLAAHVTCPICRKGEGGGNVEDEEEEEEREVGSESHSLGEGRSSSSHSRLTLGNTVALPTTPSC